MKNKRKSNLILYMDQDRMGDFFPLLQKGVTVEAHVGCSLELLLSHQWRIPAEYAAQRITTIFLNSRPIDSLATAIINEDAVIALSGAMPGLVGATMRRGGYYAAMREGITHHDTNGNVVDRNATVRVKLFNLLLPELGPGFLQRGIIIPAGELSRFFNDRTDSFWQGCRSALLDNFPILPHLLSREDLFPDESTVRLSVNFPSPEVQSMQVTVKLFASFRTGRFEIETCDYPPGTTVADVADALKLPRNELGIMMINSRHVKLERVLAEGDTLALFPLLGGG